MLIDSNIIIYAAKPEHQALRQFIAEHTPAVSAISYVEVLGYHQLSEQERQYFEAFFAIAPLLAITQVILEQAVKLRQIKKMTLGDALVAGTALTHKWPISTGSTPVFGGHHLKKVNKQTYAKFQLCQTAI